MAATRLLSGPDMPFADRFIAHRGWRNRYPENTLPAITAAINAGAKHIEIDIQLTADHIPILFHDRTLQRLCGSDRDVTTLRQHELSRFNAAERERLGERFRDTPLTTLQACVDAIAAAPDITLYVEVKTESLQRFGADTLLHAVLPVLQVIAGRCVLISFDIDVLTRARRAGWQRIGPVLTSLAQVQDLDGLRPDIIFCDDNLLTDQTPFSAIPFPVAVYEIGQYSTARRCFEQGAALVETFCIGELIAEDRAYQHD